MNEKKQKSGGAIQLPPKAEAERQAKIKEDLIEGMRHQSVLEDDFVQDIVDVINAHYWLTFGQKVGAVQTLLMSQMVPKGGRVDPS